MDIEVDFNTFFPTMGQFLSYFEVLKLNGYIKDVQVVENENNQPKLKVLKHFQDDQKSPELGKMVFWNQLDAPRIIQSAKNLLIPYIS